MCGGVKPSFLASFEKGDTRVYLGEDYFYRWETGDLVSVFTGDYSHRQYKAVTGDVLETDLEYVSTTSSSSEALGDFNYAIFPYNASNSLKSGVLHSIIAAEQTYRENDLNNAIMVSQIPAASDAFVFKNSCALLKINIKIAENFSNLHSVKSITVYSNSHKLSGPATINAASGDYTAKVDASAETASNTVKLVGCEAAGLLQADEYLTFYIAIPAGTYAAEDLTVSILTSTTSAPFNVTAKIPSAYTVARSQYLDLSTTLAKDYDWFESNEDEIIIKDDIVLVDKAIMTYDANLLLQGFKGQDKIETIFDVPDHDMVITGWDLVNGGYATSAENGPVITFKKADADYIMNTITTTNSGAKNVVPNKMTLKALTITGELRTTTMGIWVNDNYTKPTLPPGATSHDQSAFKTDFVNVNVVNCVIPLYTNDYGAALCVYGTALIDNCIINGTTPCSIMDAEDYHKIYDMAITNNTNTIIRNSTVGRILTWEHLVLTITDGSYVDYINLGMNAVKTSSCLTVDNAEVEVIDGSTTTNGYLPKYGTRIVLTSTAKVGELRLSKQIDSPQKMYSLTIADGAVVDKVIFDGVEMTLEEFKAAYPQYIK